MRPGTVLLAGTVGSTAYGLATPSSDLDRLAVYAAPTSAFHGLTPPTGRRASHVTSGPGGDDVTLHEAAKYAALALDANPTATELLWLPDRLYDVRTPLGDALTALRGSFLSAGRVRDAYFGYAAAQFRRAEAGKAGARTAKAARHLARLLHQGLDLYRTGRLTVELADPEAIRAFGERFASGDTSEARALLAATEDAFAAARSPLPDAPDTEAAEAWLHAVRAAHYTAPTPPGARPWLVDLDGTVALRDQAMERPRSPYDMTLVGTDLPNEPVITVVRALAAAGHPIVYMSGRGERARAATSAWIAHHIAVPGLDLLMRADGDHRPDETVKSDLYRDRVVPAYGPAAGVIDDRAKVVAMWRALGLTVLQCAEGDF
ncbi:DNA polymerase beta superfamily protein [Actinocorallia sp. A-T 12471]|uniref:phosphatase domain-containing protein n=1 Tax=Actinocorallia sp. A-T 12471 TaxID=3089813 RepID=UPI0029D2DB91|nr:nucleotidyltransferase domain-containing protein [Actinocorallia sp. A-T 12471]MDX6744284.1 nucleotidyltransferase domain-containing protein [Actinocorallia sp. A-T 12471]